MSNQQPATVKITCVGDDYCFDVATTVSISCTITSNNPMRFRGKFQEAARVNKSNSRIYPWPLKCNPNPVR